MIIFDIPYYLLRVINSILDEKIDLLMSESRRLVHFEIPLTYLL